MRNAQMERQFIKAKKEEEFKNLLSQIEEDISILQRLKPNSLHFSETLQKAINELERTENYKGIYLKVRGKQKKRQRHCKLTMKMEY